MVITSQGTTQRYFSRKALVQREICEEILVNEHSILPKTESSSKHILNTCNQTESHTKYSIEVIFKTKIRIFKVSHLHPQVAATEGHNLQFNMVNK